MAWSFRRRIKLIPGVHLNFSKSGISTSIGFKGANLSFGRSGTYLNTSVPGLGISNRQKISGGENETQPTDFEYLADLPDNIFSADIQEITSQDLQGIKQAIVTARQERKDLRNDILKVRSMLTFTKFKLGASYALVYGLINKNIRGSIREDIGNQRDALKGLKECLENCYVRIVIDFDEDIRIKYNQILDAFGKLTSSKKIWDVTSEYHEDRVATRSAASTSVKKKEVKFGFKNLPEIKIDFDALHFQNANGADLYFYPTFMLMYQNKDNFALVSYNDLKYSFTATRFVEEQKVPADSKVIDQTWKKVNKNGSRDKRFKSNYQIPIVRYGTITLRSDSGVNEEYMFSNFEFAEMFSNLFLDYKNRIKVVGSNS